MKTKNFFLYIAIILYSMNVMADQKLRQIDGIVDGVSKDSIIIHSDIGIIEFKRDHADKNIQGDVKVGDRISVWYTLDVQKIEMKTFLGNPTQQPGQIGPSHKPILDDRVFYDARNS